MTPLSIDATEARRFLRRLDPATETWCFRTIADSQVSRGARNHDGDLRQLLPQLQAAQQQDAGVFVVINAGGHRKDEITRVRAVFADTDGAPLEPILQCGLVPHLVVESSPGKWHVYWLVDGLALEDFARVQKSIAHEFHSDNVVCDLPRVMRLPGSWHLKGEPWQVVVRMENDHPPYAASDVLARFDRSADIQSRGDTEGRKVVETNRHADVLQRSFDLARLVVKGSFSRGAALTALHAERDAGRWTRNVPDSELEDALDGAIHKLADGSWSSKHLPGAPEPLRKPVPPADPYPVDALGPMLGNACRGMQRIIQAADAVCGSSLLAAVSLATQGHADIVLDGRREPLSLWFLTVADSGERKSAVDAEAVRPIRSYEDRQLRAYEAALQEHDRRLKAWNFRNDALKSRARARKPDPGFDLDAELKLLGPEPEPPQVPLLVVADFTVEGLAKHLIRGRPTIGAFTDEGALVFGGHAMSKESVARTAGSLSLLWDGGDLDRMRAGDGQVKLSGRRLAVHLMVQPVIAERALADDVLCGQGFLARALLAWPASTAGTRRYRAESVCDSPELLAYGRGLSALLALPLPYREGARNELAPRALPLSQRASERWVALHDDINSEMGAAGVYADVKPWASKMPAQALRIAGVLELFDDPAAREVSEDTLSRAERLARWYLNEALRLVDSTRVSETVRNAEALLAWCHSKGKLRTHPEDFMRNGPTRTRPREALRNAMACLEQTGWAIRLEPGTVIDGKARIVSWAIVAEPEASEPANRANPTNSSGPESHDSQVRKLKPPADLETDVDVAAHGSVAADSDPE